MILSSSTKSIGCNRRMHVDNPPPSLLFWDANMMLPTIHKALSSHKTLQEFLLEKLKDNENYDRHAYRLARGNLAKEWKPFDGYRLEVSISRCVKSLEGELVCRNEYNIRRGYEEVPGSLVVNIELFVKHKQYCCVRATIIIPSWNHVDFSEHVGKYTKVWETHPVARMLKEGEKVLGYKFKPRNPKKFNARVIPLKSCVEDGGLVVLNDKGEQEVVDLQ